MVISQLTLTADPQWPANKNRRQAGQCRGQGSWLPEGKRAGPSNRTGTGRRTTSANWGCGDERNATQKRVPPSVWIDHLSEKQTAERMKRGAKSDTQAKKTKNLVSKLHRVHEPKPNLGPTGIPNEQSSLGESSPEKGVHHRRSQMQADALMQQTHPSIPNPRRRTRRRKSYRLIPYMRTYDTAQYSVPLVMRVSHTNHQPVSQSVCSSPDARHEAAPSKWKSGLNPHEGRPGRATACAIYL